jgi:RNA polymerase sigma-70 factor (ECF subfamily)
MWAGSGESGLAFAGWWLPWRSPMAEPGDKALRGSTPALAPKSVAADAGSGELDALMDAYARGQDSAFRDLHRLGSPRVRGFLLRLSGNAALADDLTQEAFLRIHRARGSFAAGSAALPWMFAIGRNAFLDHLRRVDVRKLDRSANRTERVPEGEAPASTRGDEALVAREMLDVVQATLRDLPVLQREAFVLIRFEGLSVNEAAQILGATEGAVKIRAFRAYEALRAALDRSSGGGK